MSLLTDIMSGSGLHVWAEVALVLFLIAFGTIVTQLVTARHSTMEHAAHLPLDDDASVPNPSLERER